MAAFDFPASPSVGATSNGYSWDGEKWKLPASGIPDAPNDGVQYGRQSLGWSAIVAGTVLGSIQGLTTAPNGSNPNTRIDIAVGAARDTTNAYDLVLSSAITKRLDAAWAVGSGNGGLDGGAVAANTTYHLFLIRKTADGSIDALFSTSPTLPTMPSGYSAKRRIWTITTDGSGVIRGYKQTGNWCQYKAAVVGFAFGPTPALLATTLVGLPLGIKVQGDFMVGSSGAGPGFVLVRDPDLGVPAVADATTAARYRAGTSDALRHQIWTNSTAQLYLGDSAATPQMYVNVFGWYDIRDQYQ